MAVDKNMRILVVDDFKTMVKIIENMLRQLGFTNIECAMDGQQALYAIRDKRPALVLTDWNMEPMSWLDLLRAIRADVTIKTIPVIMITAESKVENIIIAKQAGVNNYIVKPFNAVTLKEKLTSVIGAF